MNKEIVLEARNVSKFYEDGQVKAVDNLSLQVNRGEILIVNGPSGSGKSTLMHLLGGLDSPTEGEIYYNGQPLRKACRNRGFRVKNIGFVFQTFYLWQNLNTLENIMLPLLELPMSRQTRRDRVLEIVDEVGLRDKVNTSVRNLSVGQRQRVAVARAIVAKPSVILADEPTGSLDTQNKDNLLHLVKDINNKYHITLVIVTHETMDRNFYDRCVNLSDGKIVQHRRSDES